MDLIVPRLVAIGAPDLIVDPGCGDGAIGAALDEPSCPVWGIETHPQLAGRARELDAYELVIEADYHQWFASLDGVVHDAPRRWVIMNPPYSSAMRFVETSMALVGDEGVVCALLRLPWLAGQKRRDWHRAHPCDVYVLPRRPSFTGHGTDSCDYAWFVWAPGPMGRVSVL